MTISPEILAEQVMGYVVWASELIPTLQPSQDVTFSIAILPQGPHFYTWLLQAAGYLLLDNHKKKLVIISQQSYDAKNILLDSNEYGPIFGKKWKNNNEELRTLTSTLGAKFSPQEHISLLEQLPFISTITETNKIIHISIGDKLSESKIKKTTHRINKHADTYNVVILTNIELFFPTVSKKTDEQWQLAKIIQKPSSSTPLLTIFQHLLKVQKKKANIVAYVNPSDFGKVHSLTMRYVCAVA